MNLNSCYIKDKNTIKICNFKTNVTDGTNGCMLTFRNHNENFRCCGEDKCIIYQTYINTKKRAERINEL